MKKRTLEELNVLDDFLFQELISRGKKARYGVYCKKTMCGGAGYSV